MPTLPCRTIVRLCIGILVTASNAVWAQSCIPSPLAQLAVGFSLNHFTVQQSDCSNGEKATRPEDNILVHYADPDAPQRVSALLSKMKTDGAEVMREHLWFRHSENAKFQAASERIGMLVATGGRLADNDVKSLVSIASDAKRIGYRRYVIVFGAQGGANPKCKGEGDWGSCYDSQLDVLTWGVEKQVINAIKPLASPNFDVVFDIAPETCPSGTTQLVDKNLIAYQRMMLDHYRSEFGDNHFIMSCGAGKAVRGIPALNANAALYREVGFRPASIDVHIYELQPQKVDEILEAANAAAVRVGVPLDINETYYDHPSLFAEIERMEIAGRLPALREILVFPRRTQSQCQMDVAAPYDINAINRYLGRVSTSGQVLPACR